ncbi:MAG: hypothetical protein ACYTF7_08220 [Planctomycetota bacterium]|jgi:hypothetical protein
MLTSFVLVAGVIVAQGAVDPAQHTPARAGAGGVAFCVYPDKPMGAPGVLRAVTTVPESEPNGTLGSSDPTGLSYASPDVDMTGSNVGDEDDYFSIDLAQGDILGVACIGSFGSGGLDPQITLYNGSGTFIKLNDDGATFYPSGSPMPLISIAQDSAMTFVAPADGTYHILVEPFPQGGSPSSGTYTLQLRLRRNVFESQSPGVKQIIFADFDGETIPARDLFGGAQTKVSASLSPLGDFLGDWGLSAGDEDAVIDAILAEMVATFDFVGGANPQFQYELRNSRDHADPFGVESHVTRVIIGGTSQELGIDTIGIAESIDPGNFATSETGVLLLDELSDTKPISGISLNNVPRAAGVSLIDLIGVAVGKIASHEVGHTLGNWHTDPNNSLTCVMDSGGASTLLAFRKNYYEVGNDGTFGSFDDNTSEFYPDAYFANEGVAASPSVESTTARTAYAMSGLSPVACPEDLNDDGQVDGSDLGLFLSNWGNPGQTDLDASGSTDGADLGLFLSAWGACP